MSSRLGLSADCWDEQHYDCEDDECACSCHGDDGDDDFAPWPAGTIIVDTRGLL